MADLADGEREKRLDQENPTMLEWVAAVATLAKIADLVLERIEHMRKKEKGLK